MKDLNYEFFLVDCNLSSEEIFPHIDTPTLFKESFCFDLLFLHLISFNVPPHFGLWFVNIFKTSFSSKVIFSFSKLFSIFFAFLEELYELGFYLLQVLRGLTLLIVILMSFFLLTLTYLIFP